IVLRDLDKLRFDLDLFRNRDSQLLNNGIDKVQIVLRVANDQTAALREKICACAWRKLHSLSLEEFLCAFSGDELCSASRFLGVFSCAAGSSQTFLCLIS